MDIGIRPIFTTDHDIFRASVRKFCQEEIKPYQDKWVCILEGIIQGPMKRRNMLQLSRNSGTLRHARENEVILYDTGQLTNSKPNDPEDMSSVQIITWWRHQMETFSALLAICAGNSPVSGEFPAQRPVTRSFDVFFGLCPINDWVNNREAGDLRRSRAHYDVIVMTRDTPSNASDHLCKHNSVCTDRQGESNITFT